MIKQLIQKSSRLAVGVMALLLNIVPLANMSAAAVDSDSATNSGLLIQSPLSPQSSARSSPHELWAVVNSDGILVRGEFTTSSLRIKGIPGRYAVRFSRDVTFCSYVATIGLSGKSGFEPGGEITVVRLVNSPKGVFVATFNSTGAPANKGFHIHIKC